MTRTCTTPERPATRPQTRPHGLARRVPELLLLAASLLAVGLLCAALEWRARRLAGDGTGPTKGLYAGHTYSESMGWEPRAGARFAVRGAHASINAAGYRGRPLGAARRPGLARVVMLGDSVAFGYGVADDETFASALDRDTRRFEVANLAVPGYGVDQSLLRYARVGAVLDAQVVVLNLCVDNDLADIMLPVFLYDGRHPKPWFELSHGRLVLHDAHLRLGRRARIGMWLRERSHLYRRVARPAAAPATRGSGGEHWSTRRARATENRTAAVRLMAALIGRLRSSVREAGGRFILAVHPNKAAYGRMENWVERLLRRPELAGVPVVDVAAAYRRAGLDFTAVALDGIGHLNPRGHALAARELRLALEQHLDARP